MNNLQSLFIIIAAVLWSTDALFRKPLTGDLSPLKIVFLEHFLALIFVLPIIKNYWSKIKTITNKEWWAIAFVGVAASALATVAFTASFNYISPSVSILLIKLQPLVTFVLAYFLLKERLPKYFWGWAIVALGAGYIISFPNLIPELTIYSQGGKGVLLALVAMVLWGAATIAGRYALIKLPFALVTALRFLIALVVLGILLAYEGGRASFGLVSAVDIIYLIMITIGSGFGAMYVYYKGLAQTKASLAAILELTWPLAAVILNWIFLGEALTTAQILSGLVLLGAIAKITVWPRPAKN